MKSEYRKHEKQKLVEVQLYYVQQQMSCLMPTRFGQQKTHLVVGDSSVVDACTEQDFALFTPFK
jgi:hypothetical protein